MSKKTNAVICFAFNTPFFFIQSIKPKQVTSKAADIFSLHKPTMNPIKESTKILLKIFFSCQPRASSINK